MTRSPKMTSKITLFAVLAMLFVPISSAQDMDEMTAGIMAFRGGEYAEAATLFEKAVKMYDQNAEAHFLLSRPSWETDLRDSKRA